MKTNTYNLQKLQSVLMLAMLMLCACMPLSANAFFGDKESSEDNGFSASSLDLELSSLYNNDVNTVTVSNPSDTPFTYSVRVEATANTFCDDVTVKYNGAAAQLATLSLPLATTLAPGGSDAHEFEFIFDEDAHAGETCVLKYIYEAHQDGYAFGEAFFDSETDTVTLQGATPSITGEVVINEIMYDPNGDDQTDNGGEWVEVLNDSSVAIDLTTWKFAEGGTDHGISSHAGSQLLLPGEYGVIVHNPAVFLATYTSPIFVFDSSFSLLNDSETLVLKDSLGAAVDSVTYNSSGGADDNGNSQQLASGGSWCEAEPTPGAANDCLPPAAPRMAPASFTFASSPVVEVKEEPIVPPTDDTKDPQEPEEQKPTEEEKPVEDTSSETETNVPTV